MVVLSSNAWCHGVTVTVRKFELRVGICIPNFTVSPKILKRRISKVTARNNHVQYCTNVRHREGVSLNLADLNVLDYVVVTLPSANLHFGNMRNTHSSVSKKKIPSTIPKWWPHSHESSPSWGEFLIERAIQVMTRLNWWSLSKRAR